MEPFDKGKRRGRPRPGRFALSALSIASSQAILSGVKDSALISVEENRIAYHSLTAATLKMHYDGRAPKR
jgi:hypothetical protein